ncbi:hypothetical protein N5T96_06820 [Aliarcobacter butzleri]|uniref:hypothetical protein n=1 Tax=Aliarcobacter butzleri TaxID=28197 RepID=UPI0021B264CC|nr:hypothetical protein [Aliarcobacter butzleri]MCT7566050.1 hypothetical protein [Aliarcobacter butzleri]MCT7573400.1 hypothetical protein [Aliarcobacter butzleri]
MKDNTQVENQKEQNIQLIADELQATLIRDFAEKTEMYEKKFTEIFELISDTQELLIASFDESKKANLNLTKIELDARISRALEEFEFDKSKKINKSETNWLLYISIATIFLMIGYFIKI